MKTIRALASIFRKALEKPAAQQREDGSTPTPLSSDSSADDGTNAAITEALSHVPYDRTAAEVYIVSELQAADLPKTYAAIDFCRKQTDDFTTTPAITHAFEYAAAHLYFKWVNGQTLETIRSIVSVIDAIRLTVPHSEIVAVIHALSLFEQGDLRSAEETFSAIGTLHDIPPLIEELRAIAMQQIADARAINVG